MSTLNTTMISKYSLIMMTIIMKYSLTTNLMQTLKQHQYHEIQQQYHAQYHDHYPCFQPIVVQFMHKISHRIAYRGGHWGQTNYDHDQDKFMKNIINNLCIIINLCKLFHRFLHIGEDTGVKLHFHIFMINKVNIKVNNFMIFINFIKFMHKIPPRFAYKGGDEGQFNNTSLPPQSAYITHIHPPSIINYRHIYVHVLGVFLK